MGRICLVIGQGSRSSENIFSTRNSLCPGPGMGRRQRRHCGWSTERREVEMQNEANDVSRVDNVSCRVLVFILKAIGNYRKEKNVKVKV